MCRVLGSINTEREFDMKQQVSVITLPVADLAASKAFYAEGLGWSPVFDDGDVVFFQFNGFVLGLWRKASFEKDTGVAAAPGSHSFALGHNVESRDEVDRLLALAESLGARITRGAAVLPWGGYSGLFADPDGHLWEVAHNPAWKVSEEGYVTFSQ
ncbi:MAG: gloA [Rhizobacter sp.]|jgi:catechol 2,3-dioxygenase-like lactoylglutathione lyase family enzyme|nr:gloA [Rhizobacter sp.]